MKRVESRGNRQRNTDRIYSRPLQKRQSNPRNSPPSQVHGRMKISTNPRLCATAGPLLILMLAAMTLAAAENEPPPAFEPGEISIGEPL